MRPRLLDLFCGAGGAAMGYHRAGFDVVGVDISPQPHYPFDFHQADAMTYPHDGYDVIHASPPCQAYSQATPTRKRADHPDLVDATRERLTATGLPWVMENVPRSPLVSPNELCGTQFDLHAHDPATGLDLVLRRHRLFESNVLWFQPAMRCTCDKARSEGRIGGVYGGARRNRDEARNVRHGGYAPALEVQCELMGIDWMNQSEINLAIPPAYTEFIGRQLLAYVEAAA